MIKIDCKVGGFKKDDWIFYRGDFCDYLIKNNSDYKEWTAMTLTFGIIDYIASKSKNKKQFIKDMIDIFNDPIVNEQSIGDFLEKAF